MNTFAALNSAQIDPRAGGSMIAAAEAWLCDIPVETVRTDAVQSFIKQETIFVRIRTVNDTVGVGYSYTIGNGGKAVLSLLEGGLLDQLIGMDVRRSEAIWQCLFSSIRATTVGLLSSLALAAVDTAVWDAACSASGTPLWMAAGGARHSIPLYDTDGGWLHLAGEELVGQALASKGRGMRGVKIKVGKPHPREDYVRLEAVRQAVGDEFDIMIDANQALSNARASRLASMLEPLDIFWFEEPMPAEDVAGHAQLARSTSIPIAVGESMYSLGHFREYLAAQAASVVQVDVARIGGVTPWLKVAHLAQAHNVDVAPHFLMELHLPLVCAVPNAIYLEHIPQLRAVTRDEMRVHDGQAFASSAPGLGIDWDFEAIQSLRVAAP